MAFFIKQRFLIRQRCGILKEGSAGPMKGITGGFKIMKENVWKTYTDEQVKELEALSGRYKAFLNAGKTERECAAEAIRLARAAGYQRTAGSA